MPESDPGFRNVEAGFGVKKVRKPVGWPGQGVCVARQPEGADDLCPVA